MWGLLVLAVLWALVAPAVALASALRAQHRLNIVIRRLDAYEAALRGVEARLARPTALSTEAVAAPQAAEPLDTSATLAEEAPVEPAHDEAIVSDAPPPPLPPQPAAIPVATRRPSLETTIGARWSVIVGGLALALGAVFLVRYSIEQGLLGPGARIVLGLLLSAILSGAGELLRRRDAALALPLAARAIVAKADVPAILTAAGSVALFATLYAAHALYGFIGPGSAFLLLTLAGLATLMLAVLHGPALAALGALGAYGTPLLVSSDTPAAFPVVLHVLAVTGAVLGMARVRRWRWLAAAGIAASLAWGLALPEIPSPLVTQAEFVLVAGLALLYVGVLLAGVESARRVDRAPEPIAIAALGGLALLSLYLGTHDPNYPVLASGIALTGVIGAAASRWPSASAAALIAGALAVFTVMLLPGPLAAPATDIRIGDLQWTVLGVAGLGGFALRAIALAAVIGIGGLSSAERLAAAAPRAAGFLAAAGAGAPLLILVVTYLRHVPFETRPLFGIAALALAGVYGAAAERLIRLRPDDALAPAPAFVAAAAVLALSFACAVGLPARLIPVALALGAAGVAWVSLRRPVKALGWLAVVLATLSAAAIILGPPFTAAELGTTPIANGLILRLGLPALAVLAAGEMLRRHASGLPAMVLQAIGLVLAAIFVALEIRHALTSGDLGSGETGLAEQGTLTLAALAFALGLQRIGRATASPIYSIGAKVAGTAGALMIAVMLTFVVNPVFSGEPVGSTPLFNLLLVGYLLPALAAAWVASEARATRPRWYGLAMAALSLLLAFLWVSLSVRQAFRGSDIGGPSVGDAENWTYSAVWLGFGIALLVAGVRLRSRTVRAASGLVIAVVVVKVFLFDMAALTGVLRALSFLGLGAVLIAIGRLYQRLLLGGTGATPAPIPPADT